MINKDKVNDLVSPTQWYAPFWLEKNGVVDPNYLKNEPNPIKLISSSGQSKYLGASLLGLVGSQDGSDSVTPAKRDVSVLDIASLLEIYPSKLGSLRDEQNNPLVQTRNDGYVIDVVSLYGHKFKQVNHNQVLTDNVQLLEKYRLSGGNDTYRDQFITLNWDLTGDAARIFSSVTKRILTRNFTELSGYAAVAFPFILDSANLKQFADPKSQRSYMLTCMDGFIKRGLSTDDALTRTELNLIGRLNKFEAAYVLEHGEKPSDESTVRLLGMKKGTLKKAKLLQQGGLFQSLDAKGFDGDGAEGYNFLPADVPNPLEAIVLETQIDSVRFAIEELDPDMQKVIHCRYFQNLTLEETGDQLGMTRERVRQLEEISKGEMKKSLSD